MRGLFVVCEGLDASGKTTTIKKALELLGNEFLYSKGLKTGTIAGKLSSLFPSTFTLLLEIIYHDWFFVRKNLKNGKTILQDRWHYTVLSHNPKNWKDELLERLCVPYISEPDIYVYFKVSDEKRLERLAARENAKEHEFLINDSERRKEMEERFFRKYRDFPGEKHIIDTSNLSVEECAERLYKIVSRK
ncbi:hypothetical protein FJZ19_01275 [Candidatus Pacearchaeota archaeon]|nr:hypothetical protein [Candidatus Pacearchaeota archaeon]